MIVNPFERIADAPAHRNVTRNFMSKKQFVTILICIAATFYFFEGILYNPFILWTALPLYIGFSITNGFWQTGSVNQLRKGYGFLIPSISFSYFYHLAWYFNWWQMQTGSSTSALIFVWFPVYAVALGFIGYLVGVVVNAARKQNHA